MKFLQMPFFVESGLDCHRIPTHTRLVNEIERLTELGFSVALDTKQVISETFFPANLLAC